MCCGDEKDKGEYASNLSNPVDNRGCTDILCLIVFILFWIGMIFISAFSFVHGDGLRLVYGYDSFGNTCGQNNEPIENISYSGMDMTKQTFVFFMNIKNPAKSMSICVKKCPDRELREMTDVQKFSKESGSKLCRYGIPVSDYLKEETGLRGPCPKLPVVSSIPLLNRCVPKSLKSVPMNVSTKIINFLNESDIFEKVLSDLYSSWRIILYLCLIAIGFSFIIIMLMRFVAGVLVWFVVIIVTVGSIAGTAFLWWTYAGLKNKIDEDEAFQIPLLDVEINGEKAFLVYSIIATVFTVILLLVLFVLRKRIALAVALFKQAGKCITAIPLLLIHPIWTVIALGVFLTYWLLVLAYLSTAETATQNKYNFVEYRDHKLVSYFWWYLIIGLVWTSEFIIACEQLVISEVVATWYFTRDKTLSMCTVLPRAVCNVTVYHLGTAAFGSFIITLVKLPRLILMYLDRKFKHSENEFAKFFMKCCICCLWCLEKCLKFLNANAYTIVAIKGTNFCTSAKRAFTILLTNVLRVVAINSVGDFLLFLTKVGIMAATGAIAVVWLKHQDDLHYYAIPVLVACVFSYLVASVFISQYETIIDALLLCFCEDVEMNDGSAERPYYMESSLMEFVSSSSKKLDEIDGHKNHIKDENEAITATTEQ